ncbi:RNA-binding S4 domain-containing protein [Suttonella ornithocola]|nr:S4 domain-containing protein [Suttonella ornithocola]
MMETNIDACRLDQWLVAARFYKTRALAISAIKNGRVIVNQMRAKPAQQLAVGDYLEIQKTVEQQFEVIVKQLAIRRVSAKLASTFYQETAQSIERRERLAEQRKLANALVSFPTARPDKRERRQLRNIHRNPFTHD